ncbi:galactose-1-phosphate uridylyltransferase [Grosmannia clavigera kw1407]|uniref:Galactose-1-phosphate uridylyltransferase n=1 Tax=Grosmannia clavigera (strain kw1407 / UAMH 11150) TaxID=655863 RepID=F0XIN6_GROCL|nr:galactose-1-phosphate uridylyltransferase [Grosmannia clavigera kw1407]EFX02517.1 galactose-1-phosphate uridylyltransferase [Grosmannia clavigera kw1407]
MADDVLNNISHRRYNPLTGAWLLVSPHRTKRPWQGQQEVAMKNTLPEYDSKCYLCPGNTRAQGNPNPNYDSTFVFVNDYSAVKEEQEDYKPRPENNMPAEAIVPIVLSWSQIYAKHVSPSSPISQAADSFLKASPSLEYAGVSPPRTQLRYMQIFENKGSAMGCSNPHPHCQVWATSSLPQEPEKELVQMRKYRAANDGRHLLSDYVQLELEKGERVVYTNDAFLVVCPWWAIWPFEVMIIATRHVRAIVDLTTEERLLFADAIQEVARRYDNLFETSFPYSSGIHQAPLECSDEEAENSWFHMHFYPPLLRSATVRKFLVGYELMAEPQRDITPEQAAARLRDSGGQLYRQAL